MSHESPYAREKTVPTTRLPPLRSKPLGVIRRSLRGVLLALVGLVQGAPAWPYPLAQFFNVEDKHGLVYVWAVHPSYTDDQAQELAAAFAHEFHAKFNRETRALHIFTPDVDVLRRLGPEEAERYLSPVLKREVHA